MLVTIFFLEVYSCSGQPKMLAKQLAEGVDAKIVVGRAVLKDPSFCVMVILNFFACLHFNAAFMPEIRDIGNED